MQGTHSTYQLQGFQFSVALDLDVLAVPSLYGRRHNLSIEDKSATRARLDHNLANTVVNGVRPVHTIFKVNRGQRL